MFWKFYQQRVHLELGSSFCAKRKADKQPKKMENNIITDFFLPCP